MHQRSSPLERLTESDSINEGESEIVFYDPYVLSLLLSTMTASCQALTTLNPDPSTQAQHAS